MSGGEVMQCRIVGLIDGANEAVNAPGRLQLNVALNKYMVTRLVETRGVLRTAEVCEARERIEGSLKALHRIVTDADAIVRECCEVPWIPAAIRQAENKEAFFEVVRDLHWCTGVVILATVRALRRGGELTYEGDQFARFVGDEGSTADSEETRIRKKVDEAAVDDRRALELKLNHFIGAERGELAGHCLAEHVVIAKHLKSWFGVYGYGGQESSGKTTALVGLQQGKEIGSGTYGSVFKCTWQGLEFAEKRFFDAAYRKMFMEEANVMRDARHPNVVKLVAKDDAETCKLVLELMDGSLTNLIEKQTRRVGLVDTVDILLQISKAILFLHQKRVAHRDIKSGNILYSVGSEPEGYIHVKVADFGLAKLKLTSAAQMTLNKGTTGWTAPELINTDSHNRPFDSQGIPVKQTVPVEHALRSADVYSFGITCFEIVTGQTNPYSGHLKEGEERIQGLGYKVAVEGLRPVMPDDVRKELVYLMETCWSQDPSRRPPFTYIYKFLRDFKASLLTDPDSPFRYEEWHGDAESRWSQWTWSKFLDTLERARSVVWERLCAAMVWAISTAKSLFIPRFKSLEEITDRDVRSRQIPFQTLEAAFVGGVSKSMRTVMLAKGVEARVTQTTALSENAFLKGAFFLTQLQGHPNLPTLLGYSVHKNSFYLVHKAEAVKIVGSLHDIMSLSAEADWRLRHELTWMERYSIALGVGQALAYLHQLSIPIVHGNLSSRNIMLQKGTYYPKLFNFYTSCMFPGPGSQSNFLTNDTRGWDAPEKGRVPGYKTATAQDVYSFGVLLLVLVTDRNAFTASNMRMHVHIVDEAWDHFRNGKIRDLEGSNVNADPAVVIRVLKLALHCVQKDAHHRPTIAEAVDMLTGKKEIEDSPLAVSKSYSITPKTSKDPSHPSSSSAFSSRIASDISEKVGRAHVKQN